MPATEHAFLAGAGRTRRVLFCTSEIGHDRYPRCVTVLPFITPAAPASKLDEGRKRRADWHERSPEVLMVGGDRLLRETVDGMLQREGFAPMTVVNGVEAFAMLRAGFPARVILLDLTMPATNESGTFLRARQADPVIASIPVVGITGSWQDAKSAFGAHAVFAKPLNRDRLVACLHDLCAPRPARPGE